MSAKNNPNNPFEKINSNLTEIRKSLATANAKNLDEKSFNSCHESFIQCYEKGLALLDKMKSESTTK